MTTAEQIADGVQVFPVAKIAKEITGRKHSYPTIYRWILKGTKAGRLSAVKIGASWYCSREDFADFVQRTTEAAIADAAPSEDDVDEQLKAAGLLRA